MRANKQKNTRKPPTPAKPPPKPQSTDSPIIPLPTYPPRNPTRRKDTRKQLIVRKHLYNSKEITQICDLKTGTSSFRSKQTIKYVLDDFNEIAKVGEHLLNISPLSNNTYRKTEWRELYPTERNCNCRKSGCEQNYCRCFLAGNYYGQRCECADCGNLAQMSKTEELKTNRLFLEERESKSFELFREKESRVQTCHCDKRQDCSQQYCGCRKLGINCSKECGCVGCQN